MTQSKLQHIAKQLLDELDGGWLEVCKVPSRHGGYIRIPCSVNAEWYQHFCRRYQSRRRRFPKNRTFIKRYLTRNALSQIISGQQQGVYVERLINFIEEWMGC